MYLFGIFSEIKICLNVVLPQVLLISRNLKQVVTTSLNKINEYFINPSSGFSEPLFLL